MKKFLLTAIGLAAVCFVLVALQGCLKDTYTRTYTYSYYQPLYKTTQEVRNNIKSNSAQPVERPGKIYIKGQYIFLNDIDKGIHVIDNSNPSQPQNIAFIDIPGNMDIAVKGNTLYADLYTDLVAIDISSPRQVVLKKIIENIFPERYYGAFRADPSKVIARWEKRDTTVTEKFDIENLRRRTDIFFDAMSLSNSGSNASVSAAPYGVGGSMARFTITKERLFTVGSQYLDVFNITNAEDPFKTSRKNLGWSIETIYPFMNKLFIGSQTGMFVYSISNPDNPVQEGQFNHVRSCDPVIADNQYAYVTLRSGTACQGFNNQLDVLNLSNLSNPVLVKTYQLTNPHGLSKDGGLLFICDGASGLKIYNASNASNLQMIKQITGAETYDVIAWNNIALVVAKDGLYQYDYSDVNNIQLKSKISIAK
jgi:hypothetical protein